MNFDDIPVGGGKAGGFAQPAVQSSQPKQRSKPIEKRAFLRRGEGVERRVNAYKYRKPSLGGSQSYSDAEREESPKLAHKRAVFTSPGRKSSTYSSPKKPTPRRPATDQRSLRPPAASTTSSFHQHRPSRTSDWERGSHDTDGHDALQSDPSLPGKPAGTRCCLHEQCHTAS